MTCNKNTFFKCLAIYISEFAQHFCICREVLRSLVYFHSNMRCMQSFFSNIIAIYSIKLEMHTDQLKESISTNMI